MSNKRIIPHNDTLFQGKAGTVGYISWERLEKMLRVVGDLREGEQVAGYVVEDTGINFYIEKA